MIRIGVISDTHSLLRPQAKTLLKGSDLIIHAGDIGSPEVIAELRTIAPLRAIRGNVDRGDWARAFPEEDTIEVAGRRIYMLHNILELDVDPRSAGFDVVVAGHSHKPKVETIDDVLYLNPGSAGPRRFTLPISLATLVISAGAIEPEIHEISL